MKIIKVGNLLKSIEINNNDERFKDSFIWLTIESKHLIRIYFVNANYKSDDIYKSLFVVYK